MRVRQQYASFETKLDYARYVETVFSLLPESVARGIDSVLLRDSSSLSEEEAATTVASGAYLVEASGVYYRPHAGVPARIELFLDTILGFWPAWIVHVPVLRYEVVGRVLFHEIGHHLYAKNHPTRPTHEDEAWRLGRDMFSRYLRLRYKKWLPLFVTARWIHKRISPLHRVLRRH